VKDGVQIPDFQDLLILVHELLSAVLQLLLATDDLLSEDCDLALALPNFNCLCRLTPRHVPRSFLLCSLTQFLLQSRVLLL
jgi:hypothetical protein